LDNNCNGLIDDNKICCIDSDGGKKYYQKGNITYFDLMTLTWKVNNDWCKGSDLREFSCVGDGITDAYAYSMSVKSCGYGCYDGACIAVGGFA
jgi:hypothetical protein